MAPAVGLGHAATTLSILALGLNVETRFRVGELPTDPLSEPEPELTLGQLHGKLGQLERTVAAQGASIAGLGVRTGRCETLLEPLQKTKPDQSTPGATNVTKGSIGKNATLNTTINTTARSKLGPGSVQNPLSGQPRERRRAQANGGGAGADDANGAAVVVKQFSIDVRPVQVVIDPDPAGGENGHRRAQANSCSQSDIATRTQAITTACCTEAGEDCSGGLPTTCNADCADTLMPFWEECQADLGVERAAFAGAAELCRGSHPSLA